MEVNKGNRGVVKINGKVYNAEIINGKQYIDGKTVDEFLRDIPQYELVDLAILGGIVIKDLSRKQKRSPQLIINELYQSRNN